MATQTKLNRFTNLPIFGIGVLLLAVAVAMPLAAAPGGHGKVSAVALEKAAGADKIDVIVTFKERPGQLQRDLVRKNGARIDKEFKSIKGMSMRLPAKALQNLANNPAVEYITIDAPIAGQMNIARSLVNAPSASYPGPGSGVTVAVLDPL